MSENGQQPPIPAQPAMPLIANDPVNKQIILIMPSQLNVLAPDVAEAVANMILQNVRAVRPMVLPGVTFKTPRISS